LSSNKQYFLTIKTNNHEKANSNRNNNRKRRPTWWWRRMAQLSINSFHPLKAFTTMKKLTATETASINGGGPGIVIQ
jgi:hypothetical protein